MGVFKKPSDFDQYIGQRVGMIVVQEAVKIKYGRGELWSFIAKCDCGNNKTMEVSDFKKGHYKSCGCNRTPRTTHDYREHPLYDVWKGMKARCSNKKHSSYKNYGGKGVYVCKEWADDFFAFYNWALQNGWKQGMQIDKDTHTGKKCYSPETCRVVTNKENSRNTSHCKLSLLKAKEIRESSLSVQELAKIYNVHTSTINKVLKFKLWS